MSTVGELRALLEKATPNWRQGAREEMIEIGNWPIKPDSGLGLFSLTCGSCPGSWYLGKLPEPNPVQVAMDLIVAMHSALPEMLSIVEAVARAQALRETEIGVVMCSLCHAIDATHTHDCAWVLARKLCGL